MSFQLRKEIDTVKKKILTVSATVETSVNDAIRALEKKDIQLAQKVIDADSQIDALEVDLEEECLKILALHQPVAIDLRFLVAILKINNDLERIGDLAVNIAQAADFLSRQSDIRLPEHLSTMADRTIQMLHQALDALLNLDPDAAQQVMKSDDEIDALHRKTFDLVEKVVPEQPAATPQYLRLIAVSRSLERIADHTTNIAEDVIYMISGGIVRHG